MNSGMKRNEMLIHVTIWISLKNILSGMTYITLWKQIKMYYFPFFLFFLSLKKTQMYSFVFPTGWRGALQHEYPGGSGNRCWISQGNSHDGYKGSTLQPLENSTLTWIAWLCGLTTRWQMGGPWSPALVPVTERPTRNSLQWHFRENPRTKDRGS